MSFRMKVRTSLSGVIAVFTLSACQNPFAGKCSCTLMACLEGVGITLGNNPDPVLDTAITWTSFVCNRCSGDSPSCQDHMAHNAALALDLARLPL